jgi:glycerol-1-phosphate dehydrogenase [NAD(P)+]
MVDTERISAALSEASDTSSVLIEAGALGAVDATLSANFGDAPAVIVADEHTFAAAGGAVQEALQAARRELRDSIVFPGAPVLYADFSNVLELEERLRQADAVPLVVGSGTLNDLTKLAAHRLGRQYMCVGTAASMDGYTAFGAAITRDGFKQTMACPAPRAVIADLDVLAKAPRAMNATGYGDLLGKVTAGADWLLADALEIEPIDGRAWPLVQDSLREWTGQPDLLRAGDPQQIAALFEGLIMAGVAMQISASSRPASGSEHRFSHLWEMQALGHGRPAVPHGFKVGVGAIAAAALYERVLARDLTQLDVEARCAAWPGREALELMVLRAHDIPQLAENALEESLAKYLAPEQLRERLLLLKERWPAITARLRRQLMPAAQIRDLLERAGCPTEPAAIGIRPAQLRASYWLARTIRSRYTVLDLVYETGILDACLAELFGPGGQWYSPQSAAGKR